MNELVPIRKKKRSPRPPGSTPASRVAILLEDIEGKFQLTMEAVVGTQRKIDDLRAELSRRIDILELAVRQNGLDIRKNSEDIHQLRELLERKADRETLLGLQSRVQVVEQRLGIQ